MGLLRAEVRGRWETLYGERGQLADRRVRVAQMLRTEPSIPHMALLRCIQQPLCFFLPSSDAWQQRSKIAKPEQQSIPAAASANTYTACVMLQLGAGGEPAIPAMALLLRAHGAAG